MSKVQTIIIIFLTALSIGISIFNFHKGNIRKRAFLQEHGYKNMREARQELKLFKQGVKPRKGINI